MKTILAFLLTALISACSIFDDGDELRRPIPVDSISVNSTSLNAEFTATIFCGSYCWKSTYFEKSISGGDVFIKTFAVSDGSSVCPDVCVEYQTPINVPLPMSGNYTFHFWRSDTSSIDTTIAFYP
ncbi:MAG: hypothetical protein IT276_05230 [Ignavibacteriaceae bacterium]|nr:hypothetical protein [Ignavibacterium sp.]MCC6254295.1 hypothetical protein [Ignavibacteriaceae bacterium]HRN27943.1 hypothetical protein [Ignavibacteriaceae bacterium]HRP92214.1 hypothetical protein [Ignavibacteriaceae bacterium]HRQ55733.1 hypothetical protein [Ignavibacteriaceae bacterium]